jgi:hypothetical protein
VQGNGHERDKLHFADNDLYILDMYNADLWPWDRGAKAAIDWEGALRSGAADDAYLELLRRGLDAAFGAFAPDIVLYNAGTDILAGDPLGMCAHLLALPLSDPALSNRSLVERTMSAEYGVVHELFACSRSASWCSPPMSGYSATCMVAKPRCMMHSCFTSRLAALPDSLHMCAHMRAGCR